MYDLTPRVLYPHIVEIRGEKLVEFTLETFARDNNFPGYDSLIRILYFQQATLSMVSFLCNYVSNFLTNAKGVRLNTVRWVALQGFVAKIAQYMREFQVMHSLLSEAANKVAQAASDAVENLRQNGILLFLHSCFYFNNLNSYILLSDNSDQI